MTKSICVWYWFIVLPYVRPFLKSSCWTIYCWLCKHNITRCMHKRKPELVQSDTIGNNPRSKLPFCEIFLQLGFNQASTFKKNVFLKETCLQTFFINTQKYVIIKLWDSWNNYFTHSLSLYTFKNEFLIAWPTIFLLYFRKCIRKKYK